MLMLPWLPKRQMLYKLLISISIDFQLACESSYVLVDIW